MTKVVNLRQDKFDIYIGRKCFGYERSKWSNPFNISSTTTREEVLKRYETYLRNQPLLLKALSELVGKTLGCWCKPKPCHGDVLVKLLNERRLGHV